MNTIVHLPVASQLVARTRFSPPPSACGHCMTGEEAMLYLEDLLEKEGRQVEMIALSGPGDPLASPAVTLDILERIHKRYPQLSIGILTRGIGCAAVAGDLARVGVKYVELQVEAVRTEILEKLFAWIRPGLKTLKLAEAAKLLIKEQSSAVSALKFHNISVNILTTLYAGFNADHVGKISSEMLELGADSISLIPYEPLVGAEVELTPPDPDTIAEAQTKASASLPVVQPVLLDLSAQLGSTPVVEQGSLPKATEERPNVAVVSSNGMEVDLHLGHAIRFLIYGKREDGLICLLETRDAPEPGSGGKRWHKVAETLHDCFALLTASAGEKPRNTLAATGIRVIISEDNIEGIVDALYGGTKKKKK